MVLNLAEGMVLLGQRPGRLEGGAASLLLVWRVAGLLLVLSYNAIALYSRVSLLGPGDMRAGGAFPELLSGSSGSMGVPIVAYVVSSGFFRRHRGRGLSGRLQSDRSRQLRVWWRSDLLHYQAQLWFGAEAATATYLSVTMFIIESG